MFSSLDPLEEKFRLVEEASERRARDEQRSREGELMDYAAGPSNSHRRKKSVLVSRFGQPLEGQGGNDASASSPSPLATVASKSTFYHTLANPRSVESFISEGADLEDDTYHLEDDHHVTQVERIAGRQTLPKTMGAILPRRLSRTQSQNVLSSANTNVVIGVSVEEATVDASHPRHEGSRAMAYATKSTALRTRASTLSVPNAQPSGNSLMARAKGIAQKMRRKSKAGPPGDKP
ncbi:hypothetical protein BV22DRAFT_1038658 [Leucogyrophana mollusca]|uniref:Uncharacterized protein n=1 Tax=Leucogyrophana mollusca TaxID=85980 RepID=A0ACB8B954_9AGAM|nr:hypothetical protein BV22DRAFT_1038658 [Leucogyrophana mollusca]